MTNKYAEVIPDADIMVDVNMSILLKILQLKELANCSIVTLQMFSRILVASKQGVFQALLKPGDTILGMSLDAGGHLTHGAKPNQSGKWFNAVQYGVRKDTLDVDYDEVKLALEHKPQMILQVVLRFPVSLTSKDSVRLLMRLVHIYWLM